MAKLLPVLKARFTDANGDPLAGGKVYSYIANTSTPLATYTDSTEDTPNENPVILDANGEANIWVKGAYYKFIVTDADDVTQFTIDNVSAVEDVLAGAETARVAAEAARDEAQTAQAAAEEAQAFAETAEANAETAASEAATSATNAATSATAAATSATNAATSATNAATSATAAATSASEAADSATAAAASEANAADSATQASSSASTASTVVGNHAVETQDIHGIEDTANLATKTGAETFTNKTLTAPVIDVISLTEQGSSPATPSAGEKKLYAKDDGKVYTLDSSGTEREVGSGAGGGSGVNYIENGDEPEDTTGWTRYANTSAAVRPDNFGGTPNAAVTWTRNTSSPLGETADFMLTKDASNRQGEGVYYEFDLTTQDKAQVLESAGKYLASSGYATGDVRIYLVSSSDNFASNFNVIEGNPVELAASLISNPFASRSQTHVSDTTYRLCIHIAGTSATAWTAQFSRISFGPQITTQGAFIGATKERTPTWTNMGITPGTNKVWYQQIGDHAEFWGYFDYSSGSGSASALALTLPDSLAIDTSKITGFSTQLFGTWDWWDSSGSSTALDDNFGWVDFAGTTNVSFRIPNTSSQFVTNVFATGDRFSFRFKVPIVGWSATQQLSSEVSGRLIAAHYESAAAQTLTGSYTQNVIKCLTKRYDETGSYSTSTGRFTCPEPGKYKVSGSIKHNGSATLDCYVAVTKNGGVVKQFVHPYGVATTVGYQLSIDTEVECVAGDTLAIEEFHGGASSLTLETGANTNWISISKISSGSQQIADVGSVNCRYATSAGQSIANGLTALTAAIVVFGTKDYDTHGFFNATTGRATIPFAGKYQLNVRTRYANSTAWTANTVPSLRLYKNGSYDKTIAEQPVWASLTLSNGLEVRGLIEGNFNAGDIIDVRADHGESSARALLAVAAHNFIEIKRIGN